MKFRRPTSSCRNDPIRALLSGALLCCSLQIAASPAQSTPCIDYRNSLHPIALGDTEFPFPFGYSGAAIIGDIVYVPALSELILYDVSDPTAPVIFATVPLTLPLSRVATNITIHGSVAYITAGSPDGSFGTGQIVVVDLVDPENPAVLGVVETPTKAFDVAANENYTYVACAGGRFAILDVSPPEATSLLSTIATGGGDVRGITLLEGVLYVAAGTKGLRSYSLVNPELPVFLDTSPLPVGETAVDVSHDGSANRLVISIQESHPFGLEGRIDVFDVSTPSNLQLLGNADLLGPADHVLVRENLVFAAIMDVGVQGIPGIETIDMSNAQNPSRLGVSLFQGSRGTGLATLSSGTSLFVAQGPQSSNVKVFDISNPSTPSLLETGIEANLLGASGNFVFVGVGKEVQIRDATSIPALPVIGAMGIAGPPLGVDVDGTLAIAWPLAEIPGSLDILDLSDPANPQKATLPTVAGVVDADLEGTIACVAEKYGNGFVYEYAMRVVDVSDPENPQSAFSLEIPYDEVELHEGFAYFESFATQTIDIYDVSDPQATTFVQTLSGFEHIRDMKIFGDQLFLLTVNVGGKIEIYDLADPLAPSLVGSTAMLTWATDIAILGGLGYATGVSGGLHVLDLSDPGSPDYLASLATGGFFTQVEIAAGEIFLDVDSEIFIAAPQCPTTTDVPELPHGGELRVLASPNPFRAGTTLSYVLPHAGTARLTIHDVAGRLVRELVRGPQEMGQQAVDWDGRDEHGAQASAGVYYVRLNTEGAKRTESIVRLR